MQWKINVAVFKTLSTQWPWHGFLWCACFCLSWWKMKPHRVDRCKCRDSLFPCSWTRVLQQVIIIIFVSQFLTTAGRPVWSVFIQFLVSSLFSNNGLLSDIRVICEKCQFEICKGRLDSRFLLGYLGLTQISGQNKLQCSALATLSLAFLI